MSTKPHFLQSLLRAGDVTHRLVNQRTGLAVAREIELATDSASRNRGLLGRTGLEPGTAMIIAPCMAVHTFFMQFTIDVVFVDRQGLVLKVCPEVRPWRIALGVTAFAVVELAAGSVAAGEIVPGDRLEVAQN